MCKIYLFSNEENDLKEVILFTNDFYSSKNLGYYHKPKPITI